MKAILTKYLPPTNTKGARVKAYDLDGNNVTVPYDTRGTALEAHTKAAVVLCGKMKWQGILESGAIKHGHVFVFKAGKEGDKIMKTKVVIMVQGGLVQTVYSNAPGMDVEVYDLDEPGFMTDDEERELETRAEQLELAKEGLQEVY